MPNPPATTYSIKLGWSLMYVQADGTLGLTEVFRTRAQWGTTTVTGLSPGLTYTFYAKARNGNGDTRDGESASGTTLMATRFGAFGNSGSTVGCLALLEARLELDSIPAYPPITGEQLRFEVYYSGSWHEVDEDGVTITSVMTDDAGWGSVYFLPPESLQGACYEVRALYDGNENSGYGPCSREAILTLEPVNLPSWLVHTHTVGTGIPLILVHETGATERSTHTIAGIRSLTTWTTILGCSVSLISMCGARDRPSYRV